MVECSMFNVRIVNVGRLVSMFPFGYIDRSTGDLGCREEYDLRA